MIVIQALLIAGVAASDFRVQKLDGRTSLTVRVSRHEPTTCVFPGPITALEGANVSPRIEDDPPVLLSHQPGTNFFSLRALKDEARGAINVVHRGKVYALTLIGATEPDRAVIFEEPEGATMPLTGPASGETLRALLARAQRHELLARQYPLMALNVTHAMPGTVTRYPGFTVEIAEVFRFDAEDVLVFRVRLANTEARAIRYDPSGLAVRVGQLVFPAALAEGSGVIPAGGNDEAWFAVSGDGRGSRASLAVENTFFVLVPTLP